MRLRHFKQPVNDGKYRCAYCQNINKSNRKYCNPCYSWICGSWREVIFKRDNYCCVYCEKKFKNDDLAGDHIIPIDKGGKNVAGNMITACRWCNSSKHNRILRIYPKLLKIAKERNKAHRIPDNLLLPSGVSGSRGWLSARL